MNLREIRTRLTTVEARVRPRNSIAARVKSLSVDQCAAYEKWRDRQAAFISGRDPADAYAALCTGGLPALRRDVERVLFGEMPTINIEDSDDIAATKFRNFMEK